MFPKSYSDACMSKALTETKVEAETLKTYCNIWVNDDSDLNEGENRGYKKKWEIQNIF